MNPVVTRQSFRYTDTTVNLTCMLLGGSVSTQKETRTFSLLQHEAQHIRIADHYEWMIYNFRKHLVAYNIKCAVKVCGCTPPKSSFYLLISIINNNNISYRITKMSINSTIFQVPGTEKRDHISPIISTLYWLR